MFSRRNFVTATSLGIAAALGLPSCSGRISFEEALEDVNDETGIRQRYISQLIAEEFGLDFWDVVEAVIYDHDQSSITEYSLAEQPKQERFILAPERLDSIVDVSVGLSRFGDISRGEVRDSVVNIFKKNIGQSFQRGIEKAKEGAGTTFVSPFSPEVKPIVFLYWRVFEDKTTRNGRYLPANEQNIRVALQHERAHAFDLLFGFNFGGVDIPSYRDKKLYVGDDPYIASVMPIIEGFAKEIRAQERSLDYATRFGINSPAYIREGLVYLQDFYENVGGPEAQARIESFNLRPREERILEEVKRANNRIISKHLTLRNMEYY